MTDKEIETTIKLLKRDKAQRGPCLISEALGKVINMLEPKPVIHSRSHEIAECPNCECIFGDENCTWEENFCPNCGQSLKW